MAALIPSKRWDNKWNKKNVWIFITNNNNTAQYLPTVLFGFLTVAKNLTTLEIPCLNTVKNLSRANGKLLFFLRYPAAKAQKYLSLRKRFSPASELGSFRALSEALIGKWSWNSPLVLRKTAIVLKKRRAANNFVRCWQQQAVKQVVKAFQIKQEVKKVNFGKNSYFRWTKNHSGQTFPQKEFDPPPLQTKELFDKYCI